MEDFEANGQFPTTGTLSLNVLGEIYAGGTTLGTLNAVYHAGNFTSGTGAGNWAAGNHTHTDLTNATSANTVSTIVKRDASGNFSANIITATATSARYADLAENYSADTIYESGTVVMFGGEYEVTLAEEHTRAVAGVITTNPAHLMNTGIKAEFVAAIALQGRVPCKVIGPVTKGDMMVSAGNGYARSSTEPLMGQVIGKALENFLSDSEGVIEVAIGRL